MRLGSLALIVSFVAVTVFKDDIGEIFIGHPQFQLESSSDIFLRLLRQGGGGGGESLIPRNMTESIHLGTFKAAPLDPQLDPQLR